jgi:FdrA protein
VTAHIHNLGGGISHAIGTGGRDLKSEVGAITAHLALDLLARDEETRLIVLISKPPSPDVATSLLSAAQGTGKPVVIYFIGFSAPARRIGNLWFAVSSGEAAELAASNIMEKHLPLSNRPMGYLRGLFSGGTLAYETLLGLQVSLSPIFSNAPVTNSQTLRDPLHSEAHTIVDLGDEFFMVGRLHPMIDNDLRIRRMKQEADDPEAGMILFDVVLGEGSHVDPAAELVPVIQDIRQRRADLEFVALVIGTEDDPQNVDLQTKRLIDAGVMVFRTAAEAVEYISLRYSLTQNHKITPVDLKQLKQPPAAINVGLETFYDSLVSQGARAIQVEWRPPAGGNERLASLLARMKK